MEPWLQKPFVCGTLDVILVWPLPKSQDVGLRKGFVTNMRSINLSPLLPPPFCRLPRVAIRTFFGGGLVGQVVQQLVSFASLTLLCHLFLCKIAHSSFPTSAMYTDTSNDKNDKGLAQTGVQAEGGMSTLPCAGGGRNPIN